MNPRIAKRARLTWDPIERQFVLLWPERGIVLNDTGVAIVRLCDGSRTVESIVDELVTSWRAPREVVEVDVRAFLDRVAARGILER